MNATVLKRLQAALSKPNNKLAVSLTTGAHSSLTGGNEVWYPLVHLAKGAGYAWVINPDTDYVCRVSIEDMTSFKYLKGGAEVVETGSEPPVQKTGRYILWCPTSQLPPRVNYTSEGEAIRVAHTMADQHKGSEFIVCKLIKGVKYPKPVLPAVETLEY